MVSYGGSVSPISNSRLRGLPARRFLHAVADELPAKCNVIPQLPLRMANAGRCQTSGSQTPISGGTRPNARTVEQDQFSNPLSGEIQNRGRAA
jgi:hypothetical protein